VWRTNCQAGFLVGQAAARRMAPRGKGTIIFTGATASLRGGANFAAFASAKFGLRAIAQSMARELGPKGIHVAHVIVDGIIDGPRSSGMLAGKGPDAGLSPDAIADTYAHLVDQQRSSWSFEVDVRPFAEKF
jgi:NAD(P)-dependent dehydrogenase (short-subunit alcohol dehydrogenase family)